MTALLGYVFQPTKWITELGGHHVCCVLKWIFTYVFDRPSRSVGGPTLPLGTSRDDQWRQDLVPWRCTAARLVFWSSCHH